MFETLTIEECAALLKVSTKWIYETAIPRLDFPARKLGERNLRVEATELREWWDSQPSASQ